MPAGFSLLLVDVDGQHRPGWLAGDPTGVGPVNLLWFCCHVSGCTRLSKGSEILRVSRQGTVENRTKSTRNAKSRQVCQDFTSHQGEEPPSRNVSSTFESFNENSWLQFDYRSVNRDGPAHT